MHILARLFPHLNQETSNTSYTQAAINMVKSSWNSAIDWVKTNPSYAAAGLAFAATVPVGYKILYNSYSEQTRLEYNEEGYFILSSLFFGAVAALATYGTVNYFTK